MDTSKKCRSAVWKKSKARVDFPNSSEIEVNIVRVAELVDTQISEFKSAIFPVVSDWVPSAREAALALSIREAILSLEKTKDSFRSKELGVLRQRLELVLVRLGGP